MARTFGARDLKKRKSRKDRKHKYRKKEGRMVLYVPKRQKGDPVRVWFWQRVPMSYDGYMRFPRHLRAHVKKEVCVFVGKPKSVNPVQISTKEAVGEYAIETIGYPGDFLLMMPTHRKNQHRVSYCKKARVLITEAEFGLVARVTENSNLSRYWFWRHS